MIIRHYPELQQINFLDERFYTDDNETFYPSVTTVLDDYPKGKAFFDWLKQVGMNAEAVVEKAAQEGTRVHDAIQSFLSGNEIVWMSPSGKANYNMVEWGMILKFVEFWNKYKPEIIAVEHRLISHKYQLGMTIDLVCRFNGKVWLIDHKSSNYIHTSHELQISAYATCWNAENPKCKIDKVAIMHLKAQTRGEDKAKKKVQGKGWQLKEFDRKYAEAWRVFKAIRVVWEEEHPNYKPKNLVLPDRVQLNMTPSPDLLLFDDTAIQSDY